MSQKKKVALAILASLLFHLLILLSFALWQITQPPAPIRLPPQPSEITLIPMENHPEAATPTPTPEKINISSDDMIAADQPPPDSVFESDRDTLGASQKSGTGPKNMPSVDGRESNFLELSDHPLSLGSGKTKGPKSQQQENPVQPMKPVRPQPTPIDLAKLTHPTPRATPPPDEFPSPTPEDALGIERARPTPLPLEQARQPQTPGGGTYQPMTRATRIEGSLSNRGRPSIAARGTPMGRYLQQVDAAIGSRWYYYIRRDASLISPGVVRIMFHITKDGKVEDLQRMNNSGNESFASCCEQSIFDAELPPIPDEVSKDLFTGRLELPFTFTYQDQ